MGLPQWLSGKESACDVGDTGDLDSIPGSGRSHREGNGYPLQYSCLGNPMDRRDGWTIVHGVAELDMTEQITLSLPVVMYGCESRTVKKAEH